MVGFVWLMFVECFLWLTLMYKAKLLCSFSKLDIYVVKCPVSDPDVFCFI